MDCIAESVTRNAYPRYLSHQLQSLLQTSKVVEIDDSDQKCGLYASQPRATSLPGEGEPRGLWAVVLTCKCLAVHPER